MTNEDVINPELLGILKEMPSLETSAATLPAMRDAMANWQLPAPEALEVTREERYVAASDGRQIRVLVYIPQTASPAGGLLWIHGGGMVMGAPEINDAPNRHLAQQANCIIVAVAYRLAPESPYPAALDDCYEVLQWMRKEDLFGDGARNRIAVAGESGGGALCAGLSLLVRDRGDTAPSAQFLMFPMLDDRTGTPAEPEPMPFSGNFAWHRASNSFCWDSVLGKIRGTQIPVYASPGRAEDLSDLPPTFLALGDVDLFVGENLRFAQRLIRCGVPTELHVYAGAPHGFTAWGAQTEIAQRCQNEFWRAIVRHFSQRPR